MAERDDGYPRVRALFDYRARSQTELSFNAGDLLTVTEIHDDTWWEGTIGDRTGFIAAAYVEHAPADDAAAGAATSAATVADAVVEEPEPPEAAKPVTPAQPSPHKDRPDLAKALRMHAAKTKHDVGQKPSGAFELRQHITQLRNKNVAKAEKSQETELQSALRRQGRAVDSAIDKEKQEAGLSELEKRFRARNSVRGDADTTAAAAAAAASAKSSDDNEPEFVRKARQRQSMHAN
eukprot:m.301530 g.301530  ORF g.301530 m.301530 type:complete len:236 (+) comp14818_c0_seq1:89-796(+)